MKACQRVVPGAVGEFEFRLFPLGDVARVEHEAADGGIVRQVRDRRLAVAPPVALVPPARFDAADELRVPPEPDDLGEQRGGVVGVDVGVDGRPDETGRG